MVRAIPHAAMPSTGFQAVILCGPGARLEIFTSKPKDFPKALVPIANRPMVWYPLDWCYRMGVTDITLITPPECAPAIEAALAQNPHLTSLPSPRPEILAPKDLSMTSGTGEIFRLPEVVKAITSDFIVLPCDLICELEGASLMQTWMTLEAGLGGAGGGVEHGVKSQMMQGGEQAGRRGGLSVWYPTKGLEGISTKHDETDFLATTPLSKPTVPPHEKSLRGQMEQVVLSIPTATVKDILEENQTLALRHMLLKRHSNIRMKTAHRDSHIYFFPFWVLQMMQNNDFDSVAEDVLGWWAKAGWQEGLSDKLGLRDILDGQTDGADGEASMLDSQQLEDDVDLAGMSTTSTRRPSSSSASNDTAASRVPSSLRTALNRKSLTTPPLLAYIQPSVPTSSAATKQQPLIRRVDTTQLLLSVSLHLAKLPSLAECTISGATPSTLSHAAKVAHPDSVAAQTRISESDSLVAENVTIGSRVNIKESVIGVGCSIGSNARLTRCLLMDGVTVGEYVTLTGCIVGRRAKIEGGGAKDEDKTRLTDCEIGNGFVVEWGTESKNEKFEAFEGLEEGLDGGFAVDDDEGMAMDENAGAGEGISIGA